MKKIVLLLTVCLLAVSAMANDNKANAEASIVKFNGTISDQQSGELLVGVAVKIKELDKVVYTDFNGEFELEVIPGQYTIESELVSYKRIDKKVEVSDNSYRLDMKLETIQ